MKSVPPRGSGWVRSLLLRIDHEGCEPTGYREVVLTASKFVQPLEAKICFKTDRVVCCRLYAGLQG
jgi:hypothetical protein